MKYIKAFFVSLIFTVLLSSCADLSSGGGASSASKGYSIKGSIRVITDDSGKNSRTAFPVASGTFKYMIYTRCGSETISKYIDDASDFTIEMPHAGVWEVRIYGNTTDAVSNENYILKSEKIYYLNITDETPSTYTDFVCRPVMKSEVNGSINLSGKYATSAINKVEYDCSSLKTTLEENGGTLPEITASDGTFTLQIENVPSGTYYVDFNFYNEDNGTKILKYNATETINVYSGFETNTWVKNGDDEHLKITDGTTEFEITEELTKKFIVSTVYVDGENGSDDDTGTWLSPFKTFNKAVSHISDGWTSGDFTNASIYLKGGANGATYDYYSTSATGNYIVEVDDKKLVVKAWDSSKPVTITNSNGKGGFFSVTTGSLTIENIILDGTTTADEGKRLDYSAIEVSGDAGILNLTNAQIKNFKIKRTFLVGNVFTYASAIKISASNKYPVATLNNVKISDCEVYKGDCVSDYFRGCGIFLSYGKLYLNDGTEITNCKSEFRGAGLESRGFVYFNGKVIIKDNTCLDDDSECNFLTDAIYALNYMNYFNGLAAGSKIGITGSRASIYESYNILAISADVPPENYKDIFTSDDGNLICTTGSDSSKRLAIAQSSGNIGIVNYENVKFVADYTALPLGKNNTVTFTASLEDSLTSLAMTEWHEATVIYAGTDISAKVTMSVSQDKKSYSVTLPSSFPIGNYYITVSAKYNGVDYSASQKVRINDLLGKKNINGVEYSKTEEVKICTAPVFLTGTTARSFEVVNTASVLLAVCDQFEQRS